MSNLLQITNAFYDAAWDLSERLALLPDQMTMGHDDGINPATIIKTYKDEIAPFVALDGTAIPREHFLTYDQAESTVQEVILPALEVLTETWTELMADPSTITHEKKNVFAGQCAYLINQIQMKVIVHAAELRDDLLPHPV